MDESHTMFIGQQKIIPDRPRRCSTTQDRRNAAAFPPVFWTPQSLPEDLQQCHKHLITECQGRSPSKYAAAGIWLTTSLYIPRLLPCPSHHLPSPKQTLKQSLRWRHMTGNKAHSEFHQCTTGPHHVPSLYIRATPWHTTRQSTTKLMLAQGHAVTMPSAAATCSMSVRIY